MAVMAVAVLGSGGLAVGSTDSSDYTVSITAGTGGIGGNGGTGGPGGDGCIILYISRRVPPGTRAAGDFGYEVVFGQVWPKIYHLRRYKW